MTHIARSAPPFAAQLPSTTSPGLLLPVFLFPFAFCFDFRGAEGGTIAQVAMAAVAASLFLGIVIIWPINGITRLAKHTIALSGVAILVGLGSAFLQDVRFEQALRVSIPFALFFAGLWTGAAIAKSKSAYRCAMMAMVISAMGSLCFRYFYATDVAEMAMEDMRYQILSPANSTLLAYVCATFCFMRVWNPFVALVACALVGVIAISLTRSYLLTVAVAFLAVIAMLYLFSWRSVAHRHFITWRLRAGFLLIIASVGGAFFADVIRPGVWDAWYFRLFEHRSGLSGHDFTLITRVAEARGIWEEVSHSVGTFLFGRGFGGEYYWSVEYLDELRAIYGSTSSKAFQSMWHTGHSAFTYALFFGGVIGLVWQIWIFVAPMRRMAVLRTWLRGTSDGQVLQAVMFNALSVVLYLSQSITANPFGERISAQFLGLSIGMLLALRPMIPLPPTPPR